MFILLLSASVICATLVVYPYVVYIWILKRIPTKSLHPQNGHQISATLVFCAYNESASLPEKIKNLYLLKLKHPDLEILAFDDGSSDSSFELLSEHPKLLTVYKSGGRNGKAFGMKLLTSKAKGEILIFTDANVTLREDAIDNLKSWYADSNVGGVCGSLVYLGSENSATAAVGSKYWQLEEAIKSEESRTGNVMGADGSIFSIRRSLYPEFPNTVLDDLTVSMYAVFAGYRLIKVDNVIAYESVVAKRSDEIARKIRIAARAYHTHEFLKSNLNNMAPLDKFKYLSRKYLRWFGGGFLIAGAIFFHAALLVESTVLFAIFLVLTASTVFVASKVKSGPIASVAEIVIALIATQVGVIRAIRGATFQVWNPAKSR